MKISQKSLTYHDGTGHKQRSLKALDPGYIALEERSVSDLLHYAHQYAQTLKFQDISDGEILDWSKFIGEDNINDILAYMDNPDLFASDAQKRQKLTQPHLVLFLSFLQILEKQVNPQLNTFTKRHLDFYFHKALGMHYKKPVPDQVNVLIHLDENTHQYLLPAGTALDAGRDSRGKSLHYVTDHDIMVNRTQVENLRKIFVDKEVISLQEARLSNKDNNEKESGNGFIDMFSLAIGRPDPGDDVPDFMFNNIPRTFDMDLLTGKEDFLGLYHELRFINTDLFMSVSDFRKIMLARNEIDDIENVPDNEYLINSKWDTINYLLKQAAKRKNEGQEIEDFQSPHNFTANLQAALSPSFDVIEGVTDIDTYYEKLIAIEAYLFMTAEDIIFIMDVHSKYEEAAQNEWNKVYGIFETAHKRKVIYQNKGHLEEKRQEVANNGFLYMLSWALGAYDNDKKTYVLPDFPSGTTTLEEVLANLIGDDETLKNEALDFVEDKLHMELENFSKIMEISQKENPSAQEWDQVYTFVELAQRTKHNIVIASPRKSTWKNIYATEDATQVIADNIIENGESHNRWKTFGVPAQFDRNVLKSAPIGFAVSSPLLALEEGERHITLTIDCKDPLNESKLEEYLDTEQSLNDIQPFEYYLSNDRDWINVENTDIQIGTFIVGNGEAQLDQPEINEDLTQISTGQDQFSLDDIDSYIVWDNGNIFLIESITDAQNAQVVLAGNAGEQEQICIYRPQSICLNGLQFYMVLEKNVAPVTSGSENTDINVSAPVLKILLKDSTDEDGDIFKYYPLFNNLKLKHYHLGIQVKGLENFIIQNDTQILGADTPFMPFGTFPGIGSRFYIAHPEICIKRLDSLTLNMEWMNIPEDLKTYYENYYQVLGMDNPIADNSTYAAKIMLYDHRSLMHIGSVSVFNQISLDDLAGSIDNDSYTYLTNTDITTQDRVLDWDRYFLCELENLDFLHESYNEVLTMNAVNKANDNDYLMKVISTPYTPQVKTMSIDYTASTHSTIGNVENTNESFMHIHPFGYQQLENDHDYLLPQYHDEGTLLIGLKDLQAPEHISLLFQMAEGSGDPDLKSPDTEWSYLSADQYLSLGQNIISDQTRGMLTSGIISFDLPEIEKSNQTLLPNSLYWLKATMPYHSNAIPDTIAIRSQAVSATFKDQNNADDHYSKPLLSGSITKTVNALSPVSRIEQPYTSVKGKNRERTPAFYTRVSERLRHKNRALSIWHYERLILEEFPDIYKVKCIPAQVSHEQGATGNIDIIVVPDIRERLPFNPFEPKVSMAYLSEIQEYIKKFTPVEASVTVKNATYVPVKIKFNVKFKGDHEDGFYKKQLMQEIKRYLAPWAYDQSADIKIGGEIHANLLLNFIEERPYVDYISKIKLFIGYKSGYSDVNFNYKLAQPIGLGQENVAYAPAPDAILTSCAQHEIGMISDADGYKEEEYIGIGYMHIALDFIVS